METYTFLRQFADSWFLIAMFAFFLSVIIWTFWPSKRASREEAAQIPLIDDPNERNNDYVHSSYLRNAVKELRDV